MLKMLLRCLRHWGLVVVGPGAAVVVVTDPPPDPTLAYATDIQ